MSSNSVYYLAAIGALALLYIIAWTTILKRYIGPREPADKTSYAQLLVVGLGAIGGAGSLVAAFLTLQNAQSVEAQRAEATVLQEYLKQMQSLIADHPNMLNSDSDQPTPKGYLNQLARAQTLAVLRSVEEPERKRVVMRYLYESDLIKRPEPIIDIWDANFVKADLTYAPLTDAKLDYTVLSQANFDNAYLIRTSFYGAWLNEASLSNSDITGADFRKADLSNADLSSATGLTNEELEQQAWSLKGATMPDGSKHA